MARRAKYSFETARGPKKLPTPALALQGCVYGHSMDQLFEEAKQIYTFGQSHAGSET